MAQSLLPFVIEVELFGMDGDVFGGEALLLSYTMCCTVNRMVPDRRCLNGLARKFIPSSRNLMCV
jgi:hypothetical protein